MDSHARFRLVSAFYSILVSSTIGRCLTVTIRTEKSQIGNAIIGLLHLCDQGAKILARRASSRAHKNCSAPLDSGLATVAAPKCPGAGYTDPILALIFGLEVQHSYRRRVPKQHSDNRGRSSHAIASFYDRIYARGHMAGTLESALRCELPKVSIFRNR